MSIAESGSGLQNTEDSTTWKSGIPSALEDDEQAEENGYGYDEDEVMASGASREGSGNGSGKSGERLSPVRTQEAREWTEEDEYRMNYHQALRGL